ncbi:aldehyde dehydrogenase family protein [Xanthobacter sp. 126]|uniref:aldehyde dehydrogenase family protein n=1 Tax=Xanthobacter sp. 126 TaxID=1131814 RepID=UPI00045EC15B|nr:aldehyde dehydrogenase family protein [Xanthobacter sp. 126]
MLTFPNDAKLLICGQLTDGADHVPILDKFSTKPCGVVHIPSRAQVRETVVRMHRAHLADRLSPYERGQILERAAGEVAARAEHLIDMLQREAGFTRSDALGEINRTVDTLKLSAIEARLLTGDVVPFGGAPGQKNRFGLTIRVPVGIACAITPFNAPLNTVAHKVGPALAGGNAIIIKPSLHTPSPSNFLAEALIAAGLPPDLIAVLHGGGEVVRWIAEEPLVSFFAFTGSTEVGGIIQGYAGLRRTQMELGSIACTYIGDDANLDAALPKVVAAAYRKAGQVCTSIQLLMVHQARLAEVGERLRPLVEAIAYGDPRDPKTGVGPVISLESAERIERWIAEAEAAGARRLVGGPRRGAVVPPTLLEGVSASTPLGCREVFGPVMSLVPVRSLDDAIARINSTPYGLAAGLFTNRIDDAVKAAFALRVGNVFINETSSSRVDLMPYGGSKDSGFGREGPRHAVREMTEERLVSWTV